MRLRCSPSLRKGEAIEIKFSKGTVSKTQGTKSTHTLSSTTHKYVSVRIQILVEKVEVGTPGLRSY